MSIIFYVGISGGLGSVRFIVGLNLKDLFQPKQFYKPMISFIITSLTVWKFHHKRCSEIWTESFQDPIFYAIALSTAFVFLHHRHTHWVDWVACFISRYFVSYVPYPAFSLPIQKVHMLAKILSTSLVWQNNSNPSTHLLFADLIIAT